MRFSYIYFFILFCCINFGIPKNASGGLGLLGAKTFTSGSYIVNEFTTLTFNASAGATSITVNHSSLNDSSRFSGGLGAGELVMIIQMQGASLKSSSTTDTSWGSVTSYNNAGLFEFDEVASVPNGTTINLVSALKNSYTDTGNVQVIRVPRYTTLTLNSGATITTQAWNGSMGGVVAIEASGNVAINGTISADSMGFRGGALTDYSNCCPNGSDSLTFATTDSTKGAEKGEGIGGYITAYRKLGGPFGRGAAANGGGGGNAHNGGGGGGANGSNGNVWNGKGMPDTTTTNWKTAWDQEGNSFHKNASSGGGRGGYSYSRDNPSPLTTPPGSGSWSGDNRENVGGYGGRALSNSGNRIFLGGGGGAGDENQGFGSAGANGGGIIYLLVGGTLSGSGTGTISSNGAAALRTPPNGTDAAGGGGGGGSVVIYNPPASASGITIDANGGQGGDQIKSDGKSHGSSEAEGPGGGGGAGYISITTPNTLTTNANGGKNGTTDSNGMTAFTPNGATMGAPSTITVPIDPYSGPVALPVTLLSFTATEKDNIVTLSWITASEINNNYFTLQRSGSGYDFSFLAQIPGAGNSVTDRTYIYTDDYPLNAGNYYLLSQTDFDGKTVTFNPVFVNSQISSAGNYILEAGPIPFTNTIKVDYYVQHGGNLEANVINVTGLVVKNQSFTPAKGMNSLSLNDLSDLAEGIYFLRITGDDIAMSLKMVKN